MSNIKKELIDFETHCFETGQLQVGELMSTAIMQVAELEKELSVTEKNLGTLQSTFEDIEAVFCDEDGCLIVEPFNSDGLSKWLKLHKLEQQSKALSDAHKVIVENKMFRSARDYIDFRALELLEMSRALKEQD
jgi:hypothetical protein